MGDQQSAIFGWSRGRDRRAGSMAWRAGSGMAAAGAMDRRPGTGGRRPAPVLSPRGCHRRTPDAVARP